MRPISLKLFSSEGILEGFLVLIFMKSQIFILMTYPHLFCCFQDTFHWPSAVSKININEELDQAMGTSCDIEAGKKSHI